MRVQSVLIHPVVGVIGLTGLAMLVLAPGQASASEPASVLMVRSASIRKVDTSPSTPVLARAPRAVSVTFDRPPDEDGVSMKIFGPDGEVSAAQPQVIGDAVRRPIDKSVPGGRFVVRWKARSADGDQLSGSFSFIAARGTGSYEQEPARPTDAPAPIPEESPSPAVTIAPIPVESATTGVAMGEVPQGAGGATPGGSGGPVAAGGPFGPGGPGGGTDAGTVAPQGASVGERTGADAGSVGGSLSARLMVVPVALVGLLVLASAAVGLISSGRRPGSTAGALPKIELFVHRGLSLPWQRHQS